MATTKATDRYVAHYVQELNTWGVLDRETRKIENAPSDEGWARELADAYNRMGVSLSVPERSVDQREELTDLVYDACPDEMTGAAAGRIGRNAADAILKAGYRKVSECDLEER